MDLYLYSIACKEFRLIIWGTIWRINDTVFLVDIKQRTNDIFICFDDSPNILVNLFGQVFLPSLNDKDFHSGHMTGFYISIFLHCQPPFVIKTTNPCSSSSFFFANASFLSLALAFLLSATHEMPSTLISISPCMNIL